MQDNTDVLLLGNTLIRNALNQDLQNGTAIESGGVELSFSQNAQVLNNTIETLNAPADESADGEAITTQHSNIPDILDAGSATSITSTTLTDTLALWDAATTQEFNTYPGTVIVILTGRATGEIRTIQSIAPTTKTLTVPQPWNPVPEIGALYSIFRWSFQNATIAGNTLTNNPNGIVLWDGCYNCTISNNILNNSRGIILRTVDEVMTPSDTYYTYNPRSRRVHQVAINDSILGNTIANTFGINPGYIAIDVEAFAPDAYHGMGQYNIQVGGNILSLYPANPSRQYNTSSNEISQEGLFPCFLFGPAPVKDPLTTVFRNVNVWNNSQSLPVTYGQNFLPYTTKACAIPSAPAANAP
jgi:parallel beta-helix repeat protein